MSNVSPSNGVIALPPGVSIVARRETSQQGVNGAIQQGVSFTLQLPTGATTSVFVPYAVIGNTAAVALAFNNRIAQLSAIENLSSGS